MANNGKKFEVSCSFYCSIRHQKENLIKPITIHVYRAKQKVRRKHIESFLYGFNIERPYWLPGSLNGRKGPYETAEEALDAAVDKLSPYMKSIASYEYVFDDGVIEISIVKTGDGFVAMATISDRLVFWTQDKELSAEAVFDMDAYVHDNYKNVTKISAHD